MRQAVAGQLGGIDLDADGGERAAADRDLADSRNLGELLLDDGGGRVVHLVGGVLVRGEPEDHDGRVGGVPLAVGGIAGEVGGQVGACGVDGGLDVAGGAVDVAAEVELDGDVGGAEAARGGHLGDAGDVAELALQRRGDGGGHDLGAGARQAGVDRDGGEVDLRQRRDRQQVEADGAGDGDRDGEQRRGDGAVDEWGGDVHSRPGGLRIRTRLLRLVAGMRLVGVFAKRCARLSKKM